MICPYKMAGPTETTTASSEKKTANQHSHHYKEENRFENDFIFPAQSYKTIDWLAGGMFSQAASRFTIDETFFIDDTNRMSFSLQRNYF